MRYEWELYEGGRGSQYIRLHGIMQRFDFLARWVFILFRAGEISFECPQSSSRCINRDFTLFQFLIFKITNNNLYYNKQEIIVFKIYLYIIVSYSILQLLLKVCLNKR